MEIKIYKLRNKLTGEYHGGGNTPSWGGRGKSYDSRAPLTSLIGLWKRCYKQAASHKEWRPNWIEWQMKRYPLPENLEVVEYILREEECNVYQGTELVK